MFWKEAVTKDACSFRSWQVLRSKLLQTAHQERRSRQQGTRGHPSSQNGVFPKGDFLSDTEGPRAGVPMPVAAA